jgi:hypothetical protein
MIVFALGGFTCIISILRLQSLLVFLQTTDISYHNPLAALWSSLEVNTGILCSCLPTLKAMVTRYFPRAFGSSYNLRSTERSLERRGGTTHPRDIEHSINKTTAAGVSSSDSSTPDKPKHSSSPFSFDALRHGPGRQPATLKTTVRSAPHEHDRRRWPRSSGAYADGSIEEIEFGAIRDGNGTSKAGHQGEQHGIQVVTAVEQEVEKGYGLASGGGGGGDAKSESGSERGLIDGGGKKWGRFV